MAFRYVLSINSHLSGFRFLTWPHLCHSFEEGFTVMNVTVVQYVMCTCADDWFWTAKCSLRGPPHWLQREFVGFTLSEWVVQTLNLLHASVVGCLYIILSSFFYTLFALWGNFFPEKTLSSFSRESQSEHSHINLHPWVSMECCCQGSDLYCNRIFNVHVPVPHGNSRVLFHLKD